MPLDFEPGTNWIYSNTGFYPAGLIVERVSGVPCGGYLVTEPATLRGMESTPLCDDAAAAIVLRSQGGRTFGRSDWPFDRFVFQLALGQAQAYSAYYNGFFDGFFSRVQE